MQLNIDDEVIFDEENKIECYTVTVKIAVTMKFCLIYGCIINRNNYSYSIDNININYY